MRPSDVSRSLAALIPTGRPVYLWGPPGVGKSSVVRQAAKTADLEVVDVRAVLLDPVDLRGLPTVEDGVAKWLPPNFLPTEGKGILFLDELAQAPPLVQAACLSLTLDRAIGEYRLPSGWTVVAASNRQEDRAGAHRLISPLLNRFIHIDMEVSQDDWQDWATREGISPEVRSFLRFRPGLLFAFNPADNSRAFPTPRSWEFVGQVFPHTPQDLLHPVVSGCVGDGPAAEFVAFVKIASQLPDIGQLLANPKTAAVPTEPAVLYALVGALAEKCRGAGDALLKAFICYAGRLPDEFGVMAMRDALAAAPKIISFKEAQDWLRSSRGKGLMAS